MLENENNLRCRDANPTQEPFSNGQLHHSKTIGVQSRPTLVARSLCSSPKEKFAVTPFEYFHIAFCSRLKRNEPGQHCPSVATMGILRAAFNSTG